MSYFAKKYFSEFRLLIAVLSCLFFIQFFNNDQIKVNLSDALLATGKNYQNLYQLAYNQNIVLTDLTGEGKLIAYDGNQLDGDAQARGVKGFYDRISNTAAINADSNKSDSQLAGTAAHEGAHRMFNNNGQSYTKSEENAAHMVGDFAQSRWDNYQSGNTSLRASLPTSTTDYNNYANGVKFGNDVNPLAPALPIVAPAIYEATLAAGTALSAAFALKKTKDLLNESSGSSSSNITSSAGSSSSAAGGMPDPDDEDKNKNNFKEADKKYSKHQNEFGNITKEQYEARANNLASSKADGNILSFTRSNGDVIKYNQNTNEFISLSKDGDIRTFFKPSKGMEYWEQQIKFK